MTSYLRLTCLLTQRACLFEEHKSQVCYVKVNLHSISFFLFVIYQQISETVLEMKVIIQILHSGSCSRLSKTQNHIDLAPDCLGLGTDFHFAFAIRSVCSMEMMALMVGNVTQLKY